MYTGPNMAQPAGNAAARTTLPVIAAICCAATLLLLLAATIVLALIPIYIPKKSVTKATTTSNPVSTYIPLATSTRKRATEIGNAVGYSITDTTTIADIKTKLLIILFKSKKLKGISDPSCSIASLASGRRRRLTITKRQSGITALACKYYIYFLDSCTSSTCQLAAGVVIRSAFQTDASILSIFVFDNLLVSINGVQTGFKCKANSFGIMSVITAGGNSVSGDQATIAPTSAQVTGSSSG